MASPFVAGVIALMFATAQKKQRLSASQLNGILKATATPLPGGTYAWGNDCGFGVVEPYECVREASRISKREDVKDRFEKKESFK